MDIPKKNLETSAGCKGLATEVPPNKNKDSFDNVMPSVDEWMDYNDDGADDEEQSEGSHSDTAESPPEFATKIPPKDDRPSSEVSLASPKNKKRKFPNFDEIQQNLSFDTLNLNFTKLLMFLENDSKELALPFTLKEYEEFFIILIKDINVLKSKSLDANYRDVCDKIMKAASGYSLSYAYEYKTEFKKIVMVIRKEKNKIVDKSEEKPCSFSWSQECTKSPSKPNKTDKKEPNKTPARSTISSGFKLHCLRTMLAFIKQAEAKSKEFPELSPDQAQYMQMLLNCSNTVDFKEFEKNSEIRHLYRALWEAMKIYSGQYEFRITCDDSWAGKKNLTFEKIPKQKSPIPIIEIDSDPIINPAIEFRNSEMSKLVTFRVSGFWPENAKPEAAKPENTNPEDSKPKSENPKAKLPIHAAEPWFAKPEIPKFVPTPRITKKMLKNQIKLENEALFIKRQSSQFISDTLKTIIAFLMDDGQDTLVFVPKTIQELEFYRKVIDWCRRGYDNASMFGQEFEKLHYTIRSLLYRVNIKASKRSTNKTNETTGIKEVTYLKVRPKQKQLKDPEPVQSTPMTKKKVNLQNVLELAGKEQIQLSSVVDLNQSLRSKKKNKKQKKEKLKKANSLASNEASAKATNKGKVWTDDSSSSNSSRTPSRDRNGAVPKAQQVDNKKTPSKPVKAKTSNEDSKSGGSSRATSWDRTKDPRAQRKLRRAMKEEDNRKEQLIEALSVPVQSDKATRMMRGMGWDGGALGARGDGITEPLMPKLDFPRGMGLGHIKNSPETTPKRSKDTKTQTSWVAETPKVVEIIETEDNLLVKKKGLLIENPTSHSVKKTVELSTQTKPNVELPTQIKSNVELPTQTKANVELPTQTKSYVELRKPEKPFTEVVLSQTFSRLEYLNSILDLLDSNYSLKTLKYQNLMPVKARRFVKNVVGVINNRAINYGIFMPEEFPIYTQIHVMCKKSPEIVVDAVFYCGFKTIELKKTPTDRQTSTQHDMTTESLTQPIMPVESPQTNSEIITEEQLKIYIFSTKTQYSSARSFAQLKFKVLFLLNTLNFVKSLNEEVEVSFNKILNLKERENILNIVDAVNMRINFGSTPAEQQLSKQIKENVKDAFLGAMFNHQYTVVTLNKYYRFKRLNRPDNAVKRKSQTTVNLDIYKSETVNQPKVNIYEPTDRENNVKFTENYKIADSFSKENYNKVDETNITIVENYNKVAEINYETVLIESSDDDFTNSYDSDESSIEEYNNNNATAKVPSLPPGEEKVSLSNFLDYYEKENPNCHVKNNLDNDSASKMTENVNNKNNIGNGNVVIDNNDNQVIDMKKDGHYKTSDVKIDEEENDFDSDDSDYSVEMSVDIGKEEDEVLIIEDEKASLNEHPIKQPDIAVFNNVKPVNQHENISVDNFNEIINEDELLKTDHSDIEDLNSHVDSWENLVTDEINDISENRDSNRDFQDQNVIVNENETHMEVISIIDKEDMAKANEENSVQVAKRNEEISINDQNVKQETKKTDIKTDCDILKEDIVLSEKHCDTQSVVFRFGAKINVSDPPKDMDSEIKTVRIVHSCHPLAKLSKEQVTEIQKHLSNAIMMSIDLPLLKCDGIQFGVLVYTCHNKKTYDWLLNTISVASNVKVLNTHKITKMALKFYCFFDYNSSLYLFKMIELYNRELSTEKWIVEKTEKDGDYVVFIVKMDKFSIKFIQESGLSLFAGVDKVQFTPIWE